jgi:hypothetical protein
MTKEFFLIFKRMAVSGVTQSMKLSNVAVVHELLGVITTMKISCVHFIGYGRIYKKRLEGSAVHKVLSGETFDCTHYMDYGRNYENYLEINSVPYGLLGVATLSPIFLRANWTARWYQKWLGGFSQPEESSYGCQGSRKYPGVKFQALFGRTTRSTGPCRVTCTHVKITKLGGFAILELKQVFRGLGYRRRKGRAHVVRALRAPCTNQGRTFVNKQENVKKGVARVLPGCAEFGRKIE